MFPHGLEWSLFVLKSWNRVPLFGSNHCRRMFTIKYYMNLEVLHSSSITILMLQCLNCQIQIWHCYCFILPLLPPPHPPLAAGGRSWKQCKTRATSSVNFDFDFINFVNECRPEVYSCPWRDLQSSQSSWCLGQTFQAMGIVKFCKSWHLCSFGGMFYHMVKFRTWRRSPLYMWSSWFWIWRDCPGITGIHQTCSWSWCAPSSKPHLCSTKTYLSAVITNTRNGAW